MEIRGKLFSSNCTCHNVETPSAGSSDRIGGVLWIITTNHRNNKPDTSTWDQTSQEQSSHPSCCFNQLPNKNRFMQNDSYFSLFLRCWRKTSAFSYYSPILLEFYFIHIFTFILSLCLLFIATTGLAPCLAVMPAAILFFEVLWVNICSELASYKWTEGKWSDGSRRKKVMEKFTVSVCSFHFTHFVFCLIKSH